MKPKAVVLDIDDVLLNFSHVLMQLRRKLYGVKETIYSLNDWTLSKDQYETFKTYETWIFARMQPKRGVVKTLRKFRKKGYAIILMTAREESTKVETIASLRYFGLISDEVLFNKNKALKINRLQNRYDIIAFVDDKPSTVEKVAKETSVKNVFLLDMPCNKSYNIERVVRIKSISDMEV